MFIFFHCLVKKGTDYYVVCAIMYIKEGNKKEYIFVLYYFLHRKIFGQINKELIVVSYLREEMGPT